MKISAVIARITVVRFFTAQLVITNSPWPSL